jgi:branched-chain amino acid transport system ATP-binding protein
METAQAPILAVDGIRCAYGAITVLEHLSIEIKRAEAVALLGANGAGKTTLVRAISGIVRTLEGSITFEERLISGKSSPAIAHEGIAQVPEGRALFPGLTVRENLITGTFASRVTAKVSVAEGIDEVVSLFPWIAKRMEQRAGTLSGGEQQMVAIGRGLMSRPKLLVLDEPSLGLSPRMVSEVFEALQRIRKQGVTILLSEQNAKHALDLVDRGYVLNRGRIAYQGTSAELKRDYYRLHEAYLA